MCLGIAAFDFDSNCSRHDLPFGATFCASRFSVSKLFGRYGSGGENRRLRYVTRRLHLRLLQGKVIRQFFLLMTRIVKRKKLIANAKRTCAYIDWRIEVASAPMDVAGKHNVRSIHVRNGRLELRHRSVRGVLLRKAALLRAQQRGGSCSNLIFVVRMPKNKNISIL